MGLGMAVIAPRFGGALDRATIRAALRDSSDLLRAGHANAVIKREQWRIRVSMSDGVLSLYGPEIEKDDDSAQPYKTVSLPQGLKITDFEIGQSVKSSSNNKDDDDYDDIIFYPVGNSTGCTIAFQDKGKREYTIDVNPFNSKVKISNGAERDK